MGIVRFALRFPYTFYVLSGDQAILNPPVNLADGSKVQVRTEVASGHMKWRAHHECSEPTACENV